MADKLAIGVAGWRCVRLAKKLQKYGVQSGVA